MKLIRSNNAGLIHNGTKLLKTKPVTILDAPAYFDYAGLVVGESNEYGTVDSNGRISRWNDLQFGDKYFEAGEVLDQPILESDGFTTINESFKIFAPLYMVPKLDDFYIGYRSFGQGGMVYGKDLATTGISDRYDILWEPTTGRFRLRTHRPLTDQAFPINQTPDGEWNNIITVWGKNLTYRKVYRNGVELTVSKGSNSTPSEYGGMNNNFQLAASYHYQRLTIGVGIPDITEVNNFLENGL